MCIRDSANPQHSYNSYGKFNATLTVKDNGDAQASTSIEVTILPPGDMDADGDVDRDDLQSFILALRRGDTLDSAFDLNNDGRIDTRDVRLFKALCSYANCSNVAPQAIEPEAKITLPETIVVDQQVDFTSEQSIADPSDRYSYIDSYLWDFSDGTTSTDKNPSHTFSTVGSYDVSLTLVNNKGLTSTVTETIHVAFPALVDSCANQQPSEANTLAPSEISCILGDKTRFDFAIPSINQHKTLALTVAFAEGDFQLYYKNRTWPSIGSSDYDEQIDSNKHACLYIELDSSMDYWSYIQITGDVKGATIVADFDTQSCRTIAE